ncbi:hypothetical protein YC2023_032200 [Brassica napus]
MSSVFAYLTSPRRMLAKTTVMYTFLHAIQNVTPGRLGFAERFGKLDALIVVSEKKKEDDYQTGT